MKLIKQPENSNLCGQACVAMLLGISLKESIELIGRKGRTSLKHLKPILSTIYTIGLRKRSNVYIDSKVPCLLTVTWDYKKRKHWVIGRLRKIYDPLMGKPSPLEEYLNEIKGRVTSYIPLFPLQSDK